MTGAGKQRDKCRKSTRKRDSVMEKKKLTIEDLEKVSGGAARGAECPFCGEWFPYRGLNAHMETCEKNPRSQWSGNSQYKGIV